MDNQNNILPSKSLGFRKGLRTEDGIFVLTIILDKYARRRHKIFSCFVDFSKFYDSIDHNVLLLKLAENGISVSFYFVLKNIYINSSYAIKVLLPVDINSIGNKVKKSKSCQWYMSTSF